MIEALPRIWRTFSRPSWWPDRLDHRLTSKLVAGSCLFSFLVIGISVLGFNRSFSQILFLSSVACLFEVAFCRVFRGIWVFPLSALITSFSLGILGNYSHSYFPAVILTFLSIGSKYVITFKDKHVLNPAQGGVGLALLFAPSTITPSPSYQWSGVGMSLFILFLGVVLILPQIKRTTLVLTFLVGFTFQTFMRSYLMRHDLPFETQFFGTISSPAFILFTLFMITDPATSPSNTKDQFRTGLLLSFFDWFYNFLQRYHTFFLAGLTLGLLKVSFLHLRQAKAQGFKKYVTETAFQSGYYKRPLALLIVAVIGVVTQKLAASPLLGLAEISRRLNWAFVEIPPEQSGIDGVYGGVLQRLDSRIQNVGKIILATGDAVAVGDFDRDGRQDLFFTQSLKRDSDRCGLYKNLGNYHFDRLSVPSLDRRCLDPVENGIPGTAMFVDFDGDEDLDLFVPFASGEPLLLQNRLAETGQVAFTDVTEKLGLKKFMNCFSANWIDIDQDGRLDLVLGYFFPDRLPDYSQFTPMNFFKLPVAQVPGDRRMFKIFQNEWHRATNGGGAAIFLQSKDGTFKEQNNEAWGIRNYGFALGVGTGDFNQDGWPDIYIANDFGSDTLYYNRGGKQFELQLGSMFGSIGRDTYKGMDAAVADLDRNGYLDIHVSNAHNTHLAEGSLLWMFSANPQNADKPLIEDRATAAGALNEMRFGWGTSLSDFDNDGWVDMAQANGFFDDSTDPINGSEKKPCADYVYMYNKVAQAPSNYFSSTDKWPNAKGACAFGAESNRLYLNTSGLGRFGFIDVAQEVGLTGLSPSRGMAAVDFENRGRLDLVVAHQVTRPSIYKNETKNKNEKENSWIGFELQGDGQKCNRMAVGTRIDIDYQNGKNQNESQMTESHVVNGFGAQNDMRIHFGLGMASGPVRARVKWCGRWLQTYENLAPNKYHHLAM